VGRKPRKPENGVTLRPLLNRYLTSKKNLVDAGELATQTFSERIEVVPGALCFNPRPREAGDRIIRRVLADL